MKSFSGLSNQDSASRNSNREYRTVSRCGPYPSSLGRSAASIGSSSGLRGARTGRGFTWPISASFLLSSWMPITSGRSVFGSTAPMPCLDHCIPSSNPYEAPFVIEASNAFWIARTESVLTICISEPVRFSWVPGLEPVRPKCGIEPVCARCCGCDPPEAPGFGLRPWPSDLAAALTENVEKRLATKAKFPSRGADFGTACAPMAKEKRRVCGPAPTRPRRSSSLGRAIWRLALCALLSLLLWSSALSGSRGCCLGFSMSDIRCGEVWSRAFQEPVVLDISVSPTCMRRMSPQRRSCASMQHKSRTAGMMQSSEIIRTIEFPSSSSSTCTSSTSSAARNASASEVAPSPYASKCRGPSMPPASPMLLIHSALCCTVCGLS
mmetsp:Transcript_50488/g.118838  ORF Transcript_50488/g.118838 Transcript_50488/m.118838 type:complete len:380 (-) Transcript_50488:222-1361(-)